MHSGVRGAATRYIFFVSLFCFVRRTVVPVGCAIILGRIGQGKSGDRKRGIMGRDRRADETQPQSQERSERSERSETFRLGSLLPRAGNETETFSSP